MADDLVHGGADALREVEVVQRRRVGPALHCHVMHHAVDLVCRGAWSNNGMRRIQSLARQPARCPHLLDLFPASDRRDRLLVRLLLLLGVPLLCVVWPWYVRRDLPRWPDPVETDRGHG